VISSCEFKDCRAGGAEGRHLLAGEYIVGFPFFREGEKGCNSSGAVF